MVWRASAVVAAVLIGVGCSGGGAPDVADSGTSSTEASGPRFCDVYLDYLGDPSTAHLGVVVQSADDESVAEAASHRDRVALDGLARRRCQSEWTAGTQGAGSTEAAAQALVDALLAGDRVGAMNIASANAIAVFEPWEAYAPDVGLDGDPGDAATPGVTLDEVAEKRFTLILDGRLVVECEVDVGVVVACSFDR